MTHPSFLALDRAALGPVPDDVAQHLAGCDQCRHHVDATTATNATRAGAEVPPGLAAVRRRIEERRSFARLLSWGGGFAAAAAACAVLLFAVRPWAPRGTPGNVYIGTKGLPSVWIYVKHDRRTDLWDGRRALAIGDRLRIKVDPANHDRVQVYSLRAGENPALLYAGDVAPGQGTMLPDAWEIDGSPGPERLYVVLGDHEIKPAWEEWMRGEVRSGVSLLSFTLPKTTSGDAGPMAP